MRRLIEWALDAPVLGLPLAMIVIAVLFPVQVAFAALRRLHDEEWFEPDVFLILLMIPSAGVIYALTVMVYLLAVVA